ncbi:MAG: hypothetical protein M1609_10330 [Firmicutes bacterium]|nr:hypothetical protein [Bacillota bacterium]
MWSRRRSNFLIIHCSLGGIKRFIIPIPLLVLDITFDAIADLAIVADLFSPIWRKKYYWRTFDSKPSKKFGLSVSINDVVRQCMEIINEFRKYGRWQMARIEVGKVSVYIDFW